MQARAEKTRSNILKTARNLFASGGFSGTSVDSIALAAKANKQRIYAYFGSKKKLFEAVLLELFADNAEKFAGFAAGIDPEKDDITFELLQYYQQLHGKQPELRRLLMWANLENAIDPEVLSQARRQENECLKKWFDSEQRSGRLRCDVAFESWLLTVMGTAFFASANAMTLSRTLGEEFLTPAAQQRRCEDLAKLFRIT